MRFTRLTLRNWRNFKSVENLPVARRTFVVGPNAIGKSNLLDALRFLRDLTLEGGGLAKAVELRGGMAAVRSLHAKNVTDVVIGADIADDTGTGWRYELGFNRDGTKSQRPRVVFEKVWALSRNQPDAKARLTRPDAEDSEDPERRTQTALQQTTANRDFRQLADILRTISYVHLVPQLLREEQAPLHGKLGTDPYGRDLLERIRATPDRFRNARLSRIQKVLKVVAPQLEALTFELDELGRPHLAAKFQHWRAQGARQREIQFSDGTLRLIGLLWTMQEKGGPLLLEEPELSLHAGVVSRLAPFIYRAQMAADERQVILSTHAEALLEDPGIQPEEVLLVRPAQEGSEVVCGADNADIRRLMRAGILASEVLLPMSMAEQLPLFDEAQP